jgi:type II secretory pathway component GspD/PulD (secretin)
MMRKWLTRGLPLLGLLGLLALPARASYPESQDVQARVGDPAPSAGQSHIDDYRFQDEQLNLKATDGLIKVLRTDQKALVNDYETAVIPINHAMRRELRNVLRQVTKLEGGRAEVFQDKEGTGKEYVQVIAPKFMIPYLKDAIAELDVPWLAEYNDGAADLYVKMQHRQAADVDRIAADYAGDDGFSTIDTTNNAARRYDETYRNERYASAVKLVDIPCNQVMLDVKMYEVAVSNDLKLGTDYIAWKNGPGRNLFTFAEAGYGAHQRARGETSRYDPFIDGGTPVYNPLGSGNFHGADTIVHAASVESFRAVNYLLPASYVDFLQAKNKARVITSGQLLLCSANTGSLSAENQVVAFVKPLNNPENVEPPISPSIITRYNIYDHEDDSVEAVTADSGKINRYYPYPGEEMPIGSSPYSINAGPDYGRTLNYQNAGTTGISMRVTPYVGLESMELEVHLEIGDLNGFAPSGLPIINTRTVRSTVRLLDGQPFVIAGLRRVNNIDNTAKAPFLGSIPIVGYLFGSEQQTKRKDDVVITITPKFYLASQVNMAKPPVIDTMQLIVDGKSPQGENSLKLGFDQYLLGS